jgi:hypothetical protein
MEIHNHILNYLKGQPFTDINAEPQVRFNKLKLAKVEMANFLRSLNALVPSNPHINEVRIEILRGITTSILETMQIELDNLPTIEVKVLPVEASTYDQLSEKNKGKD